MSDVDAVVIGAGAVGLATAYALAQRRVEVMVLEQHRRAGSEVSSRSSEVIHAGLYYAPGSLKARLCVEGRKRLYQFAAENGVAAKRLGKLVVATGADEIAYVHSLAETARVNGAGAIELLSASDAKKLEPEINCDAALLSPETGVIDSHGYMQALEGAILACGGSVILGSRVVALSRRDGGFSIDVESDGEKSVLTARSVVNAAGLGASRAGRLLNYANGYHPPETYAAKGHYFALQGRSPFQRLVYPVPASGGLGVHLTLDVGGQAKFGPDIEWIDDVDYDFDARDGARCVAFEREIRRYWPGLATGRLHPSYTGIRPKITRAGEPAADFAIHGEAEHGVKRFVAMYGIESPGITASLAIGDYAADLLDANSGQRPTLT